MPTVVSGAFCIRVGLIGNRRDWHPRPRTGSTPLLGNSWSLRSVWSLQSLQHFYEDAQEFQLSFQPLFILARVKAYRLARVDASLRCPDAGRASLDLFQYFRSTPNAVIRQMASKPAPATTVRWAIEIQSHIGVRHLPYGLIKRKISLCRTNSAIDSVGRTANVNVP